MSLNRQQFLDTISGLIASSISSDLVLNTNSLAAVSALSRDVLADQIYRFEIALWLNDSNGEGFQIDLNGGSAGMNWIRATFCGFDADSVAVILQSVSLTTVASRDSFSGIIRITGSFSPSSDGTFVVRAAQLNHNVGALTILKGSFSSVEVTA